MKAAPPRFASYILGMAAQLVPRSRRNEWKREWEAEIWHMCNAGAGSHGPLLREILSFTAGSFPDAWCIRCDQLQARQTFALPQASGRRCAALLVSWALAGLIACAILPGARQALLSACCRSSGNLVTVSAKGFAGSQFPTMRFATYQEWRAETRNLFSGIAFYRVFTKRVRISNCPVAHISVALATPSLLQLLKERSPQIEWNENATPGEAQLFLTRSAWRGMNGTGSELSAHTAEVGGETVQLAGVVPNDALRLPGGAQGILVETPAIIASLPANTRGFVVGSLRPAETERLHRGWAHLVDRNDPSEQGYDCIRLSYLDHEPISVFLFALLLAVIALPATTPLQLGDYPRTSGRFSFSAGLRRWGFLSIKFILVTVSVSIWSAVLAYGWGAVSLSTSIYLQLAMSFPALVLTFRWVLHDQRNRCPDCLRLLSNPARVGQPSCNFLSWNGTELMCTDGHGLLHIPELSTSWCSTQRWLSLDSSWLCLFGEPSPAVAEGT